ncbi:transcription factor S [Candidatus Woesearchaeota archaeon CG11_big_fil_rev_8_21_14_0_20_43_8]|nr:MAG: transcription factor S [Candidatus Woesearchaeota archaeon CG11_big_fil_rev_8_21_14_0_20_43_8]PIO06821.1 MAG: transcription factor S [Candidatus Woesearchaeota archaeon CG08_land_8_20_14_0_20_43_7]
MACVNCGYSSENVGETIITEKLIPTQEEIIEVIDEDVDAQALPITSAECPKCKHDRAHFWTVQTRASDEPETKFLRCEKCKHTWRDYS